MRHQFAAAPIRSNNRQLILYRLALQLLNGPYNLLAMYQAHSTNRALQHTKYLELPAFTLIEMLIVIGIMGILIAILLPTLQKMNDQAKEAKCISNMRQVGLEMLLYSEDNGGFLFPDKMGWPGSGAPPATVPGTDPPQYNVWPYVIFKIWNPPIMLCPADIDPAGQHSYIVNDHLAYWRVKYSSALPNHRSPSEVVVLGEKISSLPDYYMEYGQFDDLVSPYRHGLMAGSNYLMLDMHVDSMLPNTAKDALDPWDFAGGAPPKPLP